MEQLIFANNPLLMTWVEEGRGGGGERGLDDDKGEVGGGRGGREKRKV